MSNQPEGSPPKQTPEKPAQGGLIKILGERAHAKASERYVDVVFRYPDEGGTEWQGSVPIQYRRTGIRAETDEEVRAVVRAAYEAMRPSRADAWMKEQDTFWATSRANVTRGFFEALKDSRWKCVTSDLPQNPNWARRVQDLKEMGYTLATDTRRRCEECGSTKTHLILLRVPRGAPTGYETFSPKLRGRIIRVLGNYDVYEDTTGSRFLLPDHKFPEIRWDEATRREYLREMSDEEIRARLQLMSNQRNQQKREVCRECFQTGSRGKPFGIEFFYEGDENWPEGVPETGEEAERGCLGCGWYDMEKWREKLNALHA